MKFVNNFQVEREILGRSRIRIVFFFGSGSTVSLTTSQLYSINEVAPVAQHGTALHIFIGLPSAFRCTTLICLKDA
jgi:hypothetical protein